MANPHNAWSYVYILQSTADPARFYVGLTDHLRDRLNQHNKGKVTSTKSHRPWSLKNAFGFRNRHRAAAFERYLKSGSGRAFARRHF
jgi:predicted GIY-YIG superfamily endonuclease